MAKTARAKTAQKPLDTMEDEFTVPPELQKAADGYTSALNSKNKAVGKFNTAKDGLIETMVETGIHRVRVQTDKGEKVLVHSNTDKLKLEKVKTDKEEE